jgi:uncharacterized protein
VSGFSALCAEDPRPQARTPEMGGNVSGEPRFQVTETKDVLIPMRDGIRLAANLLLPADAGPVPAIVFYHPYLKDGPHGRGDVFDWQRHFAERGYACLTIDIRGTGASEGDAAPPLASSEKEDAYDFLAWVASQPWCDGNTGMWGISYSGSTSLAAASLRPPSLKAIIPLHGTANEFIGFLRPHGCRPAWWTEASWGPMMVLFSMMPPLHRDADRRWARVWHERLASLEPWPFLWHTTPFDEYMAWATDPSSVEAATYAVSAWHDYYPQATLDYFNAIPAPSRVLIGPWKHEFPDRAVNGSIDHLGEMDRWWDRWLKGIENGADQAPPVMIWRQGEDKWGYENEWPPQASQVQSWYGGAGGSLVPSAPVADEIDIYEVDPTVGLHLLPWDPQAPIVPQPYDRSADDHRSLTYTSTPLTKPLSIRGAPEVVLHLETDMTEFPLSAWLCDVSPNGHSTLICQGWVSARRALGEQPQAGKKYELSVPLYSTSYKLENDHSLRLGLAGSDFPLLWPSAKVGGFKIERSPSRPLLLRLPVVRDAPDQPGPDFGAPTVGASRQSSVTRSSNRISRELDGSFAAFDQYDESITELDDGKLTLRFGNVSTLSVARSIELQLTAHMEAVIESGGECTQVSVDARQSNETYIFEGSINQDGVQIFRRRWELGLGSLHSR